MRALTTLAGLCAALLLPVSVFGQGCVIARGGGAASLADGGFVMAGHWQVSSAIRWYESHRHFAGAVEQTQRDRDGTEVMNNSYFYDFSATYAWSDRLNLSLTLPFVQHDRDSLYEHLGNNSGQRFTTHAQGLADVRFGASYWLFNPADDTKHGNISVGFGFKAPTGNYKVQDIFMKATGPQLRYVDSSIQPGDGAWGYTAELQGFYRLRHDLSVYGNAFYLFNPEGRVEATGYSIPDSYLARGGFEYVTPFVRGMSVSLGGRIEGVPGTDAFGNSRGSRRPGFAVAVEPGVSYSRGRFSATVTVPVLVHANRTTTYGSKTAGDAAFADYSINTSFSIRL